MIPVLLAISICTFAISAPAMALLRRSPGPAALLGPATAVAGCIPGIIAAILALTGAGNASATLPWSVPSGVLSIGMDALSALFAIPMLAISALAAVYSRGYLRHSAAEGRSIAPFWAWYDLLVGGMLLVTIARNALLFLLGWEVMALASFLLVMFDAHDPRVRRAGWIYLVATHVGTACILALFAILGQAGSLDFDRLALPAAFPAALAFMLAFIGFGTKAGFVPLHVWLPEAHPAAPSGVSAVMSGVMIKTGIYGLLRFLMILGTPPSWWGWVLLTAGVVSGVIGVLSALAQHDLKRLLAYHSVENIGIIAIGLGLGLLGISLGIPAMAFLGFAGGLLHVVNHAVFKSLLFMGAGAVLERTGTRDIDHLGGLSKRMPATSLCFMTGSMAICGLPPFNGFLSELLIYLAAFAGLSASAARITAGSTAGLLATGGLALIGGLALACFTKAFGTVFLGEPRTPHATGAREVDASMRVPMIVLAAACLVIGLSGPMAAPVIQPVVESVLSGFGFAVTAGTAGNALGSLPAASVASAAVLLLAASVFAARSALLRNRRTSTAPTWGCGFASPSPSMQYTASSFADPVVGLFGAIVRRRRRFEEPAGLFPASTDFSTEAPDIYQEKLYKPVFSAFERAFSGFRVIQHGRLNLYVLYIAAALFALLLWKL